MNHRFKRGFVLRGISLTALSGILLATCVVPASAGQLDTKSAAGKPIKQPIPLNKAAWTAPSTVNRTPAGSPPSTSVLWPRTSAGGFAPAVASTCPSVQSGILPSYPLERFKLSDRAQLLVDTGSGNVVLDQRDLTVKGAGQNLSIDHVHNGLGPSGAFGAGTILDGGQDVGLTFSGDDVVLHGESGYCATFKHNTDGSYVDAPDVGAQLQKTAGGYTLTFEPSSRQPGQVWTFTLSGWLQSQADRNGNANSWYYNTNGTAQSVRDSEGRVTAFAYDSGGRITTVTDPTGTAAGRYGYNSAGQLTSFTNRAGDVVKTSWNNAGLISSVTDPNGGVWGLTYDANKRLTALTTPNKTLGTLTTGFSYGSGTTTETDPNNHATTYTYDGQGHQTKATDALGHAKSQQWNANGGLQSATDGLDNSTTGDFDALNNLIGTKLPTGAKTAIGYADASHPHLPTSITDSQNNRTTQSYDAAGNVTKVHSDGLNADLQTLAYNDRGLPIRSTDGNGHTTSYGYDANGNLTSIVPPAPMASTTFSYDALSRVSSVTDGNGVQLDYFYDKLDRVVEIDQDAKPYPYTIESDTYDANGNLIEYVGGTDGDGDQAVVTQQRAYDTWPAANLILTDHYVEAGSTTRYAFDKAGNLTKVDDGQGATTYAFDAANRLTSLTDNAGQVTTFGYDAGDHRTSTTFPGAGTQSVGYDNSGRETSRTVTNTVGAQLLKITESYTTASGDDSGLIQSKTDASGTTSYTYDALNRLTKAATAGFSHDLAGNLTGQNGQSFTIDAADELTQQGNQSYGYDKAGNPVSGTNPSFTASYSPSNQFTGQFSGGTTTFAATYDSTDQAQHDTITETIGGTTTEHNFVNTAVGVTSVFDNDKLSHYNRDPQGLPVTEKSADGSRYNMLTDYQGSVVGLLDTTGKLVASYSYSPYGATTASGPAAAANPFRYQGSYQLLGGLDLMGYRYYNSTWGRFTQPDPTRQADNPFSFANGDPINNTDPTGTFSIGSFLRTAGTILQKAYGCVSGAVGAERTFGIFVTYFAAYVPVSEAALHGGLLVVGCAAGVAGISLSPTGP